MPSIPCTICGAPPRGMVYGAVACHACKAFFKRHSKHGLNALKCHFSDHCEININTRHTCAYCRLNKCFASGMQLELLRSSYPRKNKKHKTIDNETQTISSTPVRSNDSIPTLHLLRTDQSTLTSDQWNLLFNLSHCYDEHAGLSIGERYMSEQRALPPKLRFKSVSIIQLYQMTLEGAQLLYKNNKNFLSLFPDDRSILLRNTFMYTASISSNFILYKTQLMTNPAYYDAVQIITPSGTSCIAKRLSQRLNFDVIIMKLLLAILSFSTLRHTVFPNTSSTNLSNVRQILHIQDKYLEVTWRYLLYKYDHTQAVKCFSDFIRCIFIINEDLTEQWFTDTIDSLIQKTEQTF